VRAVLYARVSTESEEQATSIPTQLERCRQYCAAKGWEVAAEYTDTLSGTRLDRAGFQAAVALLHGGAAQVLVAATLDRIARTTEFTKFLRDEIQARGADVSTVDGGFDTTTASGRFLLSVLLSSYQYTVEQSSEKLRATNRLKRSRGIQVSGRPFGSMADGNGGRCRDPETYPILLEIFRRVAAGEPLVHIAASLRARNVPTVNGGCWWQSSVSSIVRCRWYLGEIVHEGATVAHAEHDCMVPAELWQAAQRSGGRGRPSGYIHLLQGLVVCSHWRYTAPPGKAGQSVTYRGQSSRGRGVYRRYDERTHPYYTIEAVDDPGDMPRALDAAELEGIVIPTLIELCQSGELYVRARAGADALLTQARARVAALRKQHSRAQAAHKRAQARLLKALDSEAGEAIRALDAAAGAARREAERLAAELEAAAVDAQSTIVDTSSTAERVNLIAAAWEQGRRRELRALIAGVLKQVDVRRDGLRLVLRDVLSSGGNNIPVYASVKYMPRLTRA